MRNYIVLLDSCDGLRPKLRQACLLIRVLLRNTIGKWSRAESGVACIRCRGSRVQ